MSTGSRDHGFFVGYFKTVPPAIRRFCLMAGVFLLCFLASLALFQSLGTAHPGAGAYVDELKGATLTGTLETQPYPVLRVAATDGRPARAIMLSGQGKLGVQGTADPLSGQLVEAGGVFVKRGDLDMLLVGGRVGLKAVEADAGAEQVQPPAALASEVLGRFRLTGEICDGKCYGGAMRPGNGLAHRACANLCITGGLPPVFVTTAPVEGHSTLLMAGPDGGPLPARLLKLTALPIQLEGTIERRDDLLVFRVDAAAVEAAR